VFPSVLEEGILSYPQLFFSYSYYLPFIVLSICNSISENSILELLETVDKVLFGVNVTYNCSTVDKKVFLLPIH
jgi:hypothetical protein